MVPVAASYDAVLVKICHQPASPNQDSRVAVEASKRLVCAKTLIEQNARTKRKNFFIIFLCLIIRLVFVVLLIYYVRVGDIEPHKRGTHISLQHTYRLKKRTKVLIIYNVYKFSQYVIKHISALSHYYKITSHTFYPFDFQYICFSQITSSKNFQFPEKKKS